MTVNIPPTVLPTKKPNRQRFRRPWNSDPSCVLCLMPEVNSTWRDYSGHGNDGTIVGATTIYNARFGEGLLFDGINDYVTMGDVLDFERTDPFTLEAWFMRTIATANHTLISKMDSANDYRGYLFWVRTNAGGNPNVLEFNIRNDNAPPNFIYVRGTTEVPLNIWHHGVVTYDGSVTIAGTHIYLDSSEEVIADSVNTLNATTIIAKPLCIGSRNLNNSLFEGSIDEARIYNRALAAWEVRALYEMGR